MTGGMDTGKDLLRLTTAGSVDDGKSTLIGRLLMDCQAVYEDQLAAMQSHTQQRGGQEVDLALLTDGLKAEREQGITIDVAYRYFSTDCRKFIIADSPGHEQYTRNMVTGASTADLAIILVDARNGATTQSHRHAYIASLLGIRHMVVAINKMDLVGYEEEVFERIHEEFQPFCDRLAIPDVRFIPMSALKGDMIVSRGDAMPWYQGETLLEALEGVSVARDQNLSDFRFPVQLVNRPQLPELHDFRGYMGQVASGVVRVGDPVVVLPSGLSSRVARIVSYDGDLEDALATESVNLTLTDDLDISRGDMLVQQDSQPRVAKELEAMLCWMDAEPMRPRHKYLIKHTTNTVRAMIQEVQFKVDVNTAETVPADGDLTTNDIGRVRIRLQRPLVVDDYRRNRETGAFIMIDPDTNNTVAAGMVYDDAP